MLSTVFLPITILALIVMLLAPGLLVGILLQRKYRFQEWYVLPFAGLTTGLMGYLTFCIYIIHPTVGEWFTFLITVASVLIAIGLVASIKTWKVLTRNDVLIPLILMFGVSLFYNGAALACRADEFSRSCYTADVSLDDDVAQLFAANVEKGTPKERIGDWQGSDRPPLLPGIILTQGLFTADVSTGEINSQLVSSIAQCLWIGAIWALCRAIGLKAKDVLFITLLCIFSGFFFFNSVLVWPKLLAASYVILAFCLLFFEKPSRVTWLFASIAGSAALLSHTGAIYTLIPIATILMLHGSYRASWRTILMAIGCVLVLITPWLLYQRYYDPPGDRLGKWFLAGVVPIDDRSITDTIVDSYSSTPLKELVKARIINLSQLVGRIPPEDSLVGTGKLAQLRDAEFRYVLFSLGLLNLGWLALFSKKIRHRLKKTGTMQHIQLLSTVAGLSLLTWILVLFTPGIATTHVGSYAAIMMLFVVLGSLIIHLPSKIKLGILALQLGYFMLVWIVSVLLRNPIISADILALMLGLGLIGFYFIKGDLSGLRNLNNGKL